MHASFVPSGLRLGAEHLSAIDRAWDAANTQRGVELFDGPLCRLEDLAVDGDGLHLRLSPTGYRLFIGTNGRHPQWAEEYGRQVMADPVGTSAILLSSDGVLVFGRRSQRVALYPGFIHPFGGTLEPPAEATVLDPFAEMRRELMEEVGIDADDIADLRIIAVVEDRHLRQPELLYAARTRLTTATITQRLDRHEHSGCWMLPDEQQHLEAVLHSDDTITPVLAGALLAWGWRRFGDEWLDAHLTCRDARRQPVARWG